MKKTKKQIEKELKRTKIACYILIFTDVLWMISFLWLADSVGLIPTFNEYETNYGENISDLITISYDNLTTEEIQNVNEIMSQIKPEYLYGSNEIIFTNNIENYCKTCTGLNQGNGHKISIEYRWNKEVMKRTICHELFHSFIIGEIDTPLHDVIYDLADYRSCFI